MVNIFIKEYNKLTNTFNGIISVLSFIGSKYEGGMGLNKHVIELFAGVGGFRLGLEKAADFEVVWGNQFEPSKKVQDAFNCYSSRFEGRGIHSNQDISTVETSEIPDHTLMVGGFPCQDYSVARTNAEGINGKKGVLFWEIIRILTDKRPPFVLLENVDRLLKSPSKQRGRDFLVMLKALNDLGYAVEWRVINAANHGFAQKRKRVFIFAFHRDTKQYQAMKGFTPEKVLHSEGMFARSFKVEEQSSEKHPPTSYTLDSDIVDVSESGTMIIRSGGIMIEGEIYSEEVLPVFEGFIPLEDILEKNVPESYYLSDDQLSSWEYLKGSKRIERESKSGHKYIYSEGQMSFPDPLDRPARTLLTSEGTKNRSSHVIRDPETGRLRRMTPLECERANGFEDNWTDTGMRESFRYFCMGNALVVGIIERLGKEIAYIIDRE